MRKIFSGIVLFLFVTLSCGAGGGSGGGKPAPPTGPFLKFSCEGADSYYIDVLNITDEAHDYLPDDANEAHIDLGAYNLEDGIYEVEVSGENIDGMSDKIKFDLEISTAKGIRTWEIVPIDEIIKVNPEYIKSFDTINLIVEMKPVRRK